MTVMVYYSASAQGRLALQAAGREAHLRSTDLVVLVVRGDEGGQAEPAVLAAVEEDVRDAFGTTHGSLTWTLESMPPGTGGDEVDAVLNLVATRRPELFVLGSRHRSAVGKILLGRDLQRLLLEVSAPILLVKTPAV